MNPESPVTFSKPEVLEWLKTVKEPVWSHPAAQFSIWMGKDTQFTDAVQDIANQQANGRVLGYEALLVILIWTLRAWRLSKVSTWLTRMWTQAWVAAIFWILAVIPVPYLVWGLPYRIALTQLLRGIFRHFI